VIDVPAHGVVIDTAAARVPPLYKNCTNLTKRYPHGVGRLGARDKTSGTPVTTFTRSTRIYRLAMSYNSRSGTSLTGSGNARRIGPPG
jgi:hypothetical protein